MMYLWKGRVQSQISAAVITKVFVPHFQLVHKYLWEVIIKEAGINTFPVRINLLFKYVNVAIRKAIIEV
jgi:hypothetical protein